MTKPKNVREAFKRIPSLDEILKSYNLENIPLELFKNKLRESLKKIRFKIENDNIPNDIYQHTLDEALKDFNYIKGPSLKRVINGTGIILNTRLGRAPI